MATRKMYRCLNLDNGSIGLYDWVYDGYVSLDTIEVHYDNQLRPEHAQMVADAIDKRINKLQADIVIMEQKKKDLLCITHNNEGYYNGYQDLENL